MFLIVIGIYGVRAVGWLVAVIGLLVGNPAVVETVKEYNHPELTILLSGIEHGFVMYVLISVFLLM